MSKTSEQSQNETISKIPFNAPCLVGIPEGEKLRRIRLLRACDFVQRAFARRGRILTALVMILVLISLISGSKLGFLQRFGSQLTPLGWLEMFVILSASIVSSSNFLTTVDSITRNLRVLQPGEDNWYLLTIQLFLEQLFYIGNVFAFVYALWTVLSGDPIKHLWAVYLIYAFFTANNFVQSRIANRLKGSTVWHYAHPHLLRLQHWLLTENGPAMFGYGLLVSLLAWASRWSGWYSLNHGIEPTPVIEVLKIFSAGVAGYHLALSTLTYWSWEKGLTAELLETNIWFVSDPAGFKAKIHRVVHNKRNIKIFFVLFVITTASAFVPGWANIASPHKSEMSQEQSADQNEP